MTTHSSVPSVRGNFDTGPLSWVMAEIREALTQSKSALQEAIGQDEERQSTALRHAKTYLHQAHGALQIVDIDGIPLITENVEELLAQMESGKLPLTTESAQVVSDGYQALIEYLEELLAGAPHQPVRLFPYYKALMETRGAEKIHPSDLFFPNLAIRPQLPLAQDDSAAINYVAVRQRFERALLSFLKAPDTTTQLATASVMSGLIGEIEQGQSNQQLRAFWWVLRGFSEVVAAGKISNTVYVKQLFARINLQIRRLSEGSNSIGERLLRDALFAIASAESPPPQVQQIRAAYQLDGMVPSNYELKRYAQIDAGTLALAKEKLTQAKNLWNRIAGGDATAAPGFEQEMNALADAGSRLNSPSLSKLLRELNGIARHAANSSPGESLGLEVATALLFVENALSHPSRLSDDFAERADAITARLLSIVAGEQPAQAAEWLDDMSHQEQQRQTMTVLASEMQASLAQTEKMLDEYFANPSKRAMLETIDAVMHQIEGALAILDQDDAMRAVKHVRAQIEQFAQTDADAVPDRQAFQRVAENVGALSFFIETLQLNSDGIEKRFVFDDKLGTFRANLLEKKDLGKPTLVEIDPLRAPENKGRRASDPIPAPAPTPLPDLPTVEDELISHQQQSADLATSLAAQPDNPELRQQLRESLVQVRSDAALVDDADATDRAQAAIDLLQSPDFVPSEQSYAEIASAAVSSVAQPAQTAMTPVDVPDTEEEVDAELLEIFLAEAQEVLECVRQNLPLLRNDAGNQEYMTSLRRSFHTLKGSGRMVGLMAFGEAAWNIEQVLNLRLAEGQGGAPDLYALLEKSAEVLDAWVTELLITGRSQRTAEALAKAAQLVKDGSAFHYEEVDHDLSIDEARSDGDSSEFPDALEVSGAVDLPAELTLPQVEETQMSDEEMGTFHLEGNAFLPTPEHEETQPSESSESNSTPSPRSRIADIIDFPEVHPLERKLDDNVKRIGHLEISLPLHNIYLAETDELVRLLSNDFSEWRHEAHRHVNILAVHAAHSLAGSSATVGFESLQEVAHALEMLLQSLARKPATLLDAEYDELERSVDCLKLMLQKFALDEMPEHEPAQVMRLKQMQLELIARAGYAEAETSAVLPPFEEIGNADEVLPDFDVSILPVSETDFHFDSFEPAAPIENTAINFPAETADALDTETSPEPESDATFAGFANQVTLSKEELDADLLPVFLEEGSDLLPQMESLLRTWQQAPGDVSAPQGILRLLHTIKGSARMAGAMELGQHMHLMETRIEQITRLGVPSAETIEDLLSRLDLGLFMFDRLQNPQQHQAAASRALQAEAFQGVADSAELAGEQEIIKESAGGLATIPAYPQANDDTVKSVAAQAASVASVPQVRVRADILDRLVNQAGEVSISRSKIENEVDTLRSSLSELTENVSRLRNQLREIEMQAETQIASQMAQSADREFDPLEFDRFTRLQELTRIMAESVNDVASVQQNLTKTVDGATTDLIMQARLTRDLQQDLMRVRMVQFASISERLFRVTRQASKEIDKRVHLDIRGGAVEIDRSVLDKMAGPFEHLLRNSIVHGIEAREARVAAGKSEIGELIVEIRQEGNEVVIQFSDDGQGLNLNRIRDKATATGLLTDDTELSDAEVQDLIFHPGFSTASEVTELAGRGIGMDVVRAEAASLGGRIAIHSEQGKGAHFIIRLPLTLAVTQVVLLSTGGRLYAVPSVLVEQVQQLKANPLAGAYNDGAIMWQGNRVPLYYLSALLGDTDAAPITQQYSPVVTLKSGSERVAIHVDEILGNREVVVKNIGPQLSRMIGIAGATVLGSGDIVLILNPLPLAARLQHENARAPRILASDAPHEMGAVAELARPSSPDSSQSAPVQGLRTQHIVMVVDDSLTVRRVTQRLLAREGYQVVLAKDGVDALEQLQAITPDVMLVDIEMPRMDGFDLTRNVRSDERTRHIPIIMITSRTATKHRSYASELGVNEYMGKPFQEAELLQHIAQFVNKTAPIE